MLEEMGYIESKSNRDFLTFCLVLFLYIISDVLEL